MADEDRSWTDPARPPVDAIDCGGGVWVSWASAFNTGDAPLLWHWCSTELWRQRGATEATPRWAPTGVAAHTLVSRDPIHLEPSVLWPGCCGKHGFLRAGRWQEC